MATVAPTTPVTVSPTVSGTLTPASKSSGGAVIEEFDVDGFKGFDDEFGLNVSSLDKEVVASAAVGADVVVDIVCEVSIFD